MKVAVLAENTSVGSDFECEHGLSLYIEACGKKILFDMGQTDMFLRNANRLGIDLAEVDFAILSHGHYDHGGGLSTFLDINSNAPVYLSRYAFEPHYNGTEKYIGLDISLSNNPRIIFTDGDIVINDDITLFSNRSIYKSHSVDSCGLMLLENGEYIDEDFRHEQYLMIKENNRKFLFSGCSHNGILNVCQSLNADVVLGGFHLSKVDSFDVLDDIAEVFDCCDTVFYTCHCTGEVQYSYLKKKMNKLWYLSSGACVEI